MKRNLASRRNFDSVKAQLWPTCRVLKNSSILEIDSRKFIYGKKSQIERWKSLG